MLSGQMIPWEWQYEICHVVEAETDTTNETVYVVNKITLQESKQRCQ